MAARGKKLINDPNDVVTQFIEGLAETYPGLQYLDGFPEIKVVLRSDVAVGTYDKVAVICGNHAHLGTFMGVNFNFGLGPMIRLGFGGNRG